MIKIALLLTLATGTAFYAGGRTTYSGTQTQLFPGSALKVTPDPSNIWSFHETVTVPYAGTVNVPVLVDFDNNQKMDTELSFARVLITDMQISIAGVERGSFESVTLLDDVGPRWVLTPGLESVSLARLKEHHLTTPLALPLKSGLRIKVIRSVAGNRRSAQITINLIGRLVTM